jgi:dipeptidyl-peptidase-3
MTRRYLLEQIDDAAVVQYYADGFDALPVDAKILCWHLYQAALAGRDIYYDQRYRHALDMRNVIEEMLVHHPLGRRGGDSGEASAVIDEIRRYAKLFWINSGPHGSISARKFVLGCSREAFAEAARVAEASGARFPYRDGATRLPAGPAGGFLRALSGRCRRVRGFARRDGAPAPQRCELRI